MPKYYDLTPYEKFTINKQYSSEYDRGWCSAIKRIMSDKPLDVQEVKHGWWMKNGDRYCECSVCHHEGNTSGSDIYCWFCGAKMDR